MDDHNTFFFEKKNTEKKNRQAYDSLTHAGGMVRGLFFNIMSSSVSIFLYTVGIVDILLLDISNFRRFNLLISEIKFTHIHEAKSSI